MGEIFVCAVDASKLDIGGAGFRELISPLRLERIAALRHDMDKRRSLGAELALDGALRARFADYCPPPQYRYAAGGKPELPDARAHISLAHAGDWAICALADFPVGVDIERADRKSPLPVWEWVGVESYLKLTGEGLSGQFRALHAGEREVSLEGSRVAFLSRADWRGCLICAASGERADIAVRERRV